MLALLASLALSQAAAPAPVQTAVPTTVSSTPVEVVAPTQPRRICRIERGTATRISARRVCQTVQERDQERDQQQRSTEETQNRNWDRYWGCRPLSPMAAQGLNAYRSNGSPQ